MHDLRRRGLGKDVRSRILNHKDLSVDAIYDRYAYFDEKAQALSEWHTLLKSLLQREFGNDADWVDFYGTRREAAEELDDGAE